MTCIQFGNICIVITTVKPQHIAVNSHSTGFGDIVSRVCPGTIHFYGLFVAAANYFYRSTGSIRPKIELYICPLFYLKRNVTRHIDIRRLHRKINTYYRQKGDKRSFKIFFHTCKKNLLINKTKIFLNPTIPYQLDCLLLAAKLIKK